MMKGKDIIKVIEQYDLGEEEVNEVLKFASIMENGRPAMCGNCIKRRSDICPWPNSAIYEPPCLEYSAIKINN